ncbi:MAG TPA: nitrate reductase, partial [Fluviicoccus sp.]|nr:nitrate reductase [Fluviicoccus sp.]
MKTEVKSTCCYCGVGCGLLVESDNGKITGVRGDPEHPANFGRLCTKGASLAQTADLTYRLQFPEARPLRGGASQRISWDAALDQAAERFASIIREHGPDAVAFYISGQLMTEDYYVFNKLAKGLIGTNNVDTNSRLCMSSAVAGYKRAFGADSVPASYDDFAHAELMVLVGSNTAWCHPIIFQRIKAIKAEKPNLKVVVIDPRETATNEIADLHLPIRSGGDVLLFNALLAELAARGAVDAHFTATHCTGLEAAVASAIADRGDHKTLAERLGIPADRLQTFFDWFTATERTLTLYSMGVNQSSAGTDKANAIINCHLATGRIGKPGAAPFSLTGQPNAMGGREVGGLANMLAAHMDLENPVHRERVQRFWQSPSIPEKSGLKAVDLFDAVHDGRVKAVWIMATNPVVSLPNADRVRAALEKCELVIVSDCIADTDTMRLAHIKLPALGWGEKDGTVTNSERRISRQRGLLPPPGEAKPDWWALAEVGKALGYKAGFSYTHPAQIFREHAALSAFENNAESGLRDFNIGLLAQLDNSEYNALKPVQWPVTPDAPLGTERLFSDNRFYTPDGKARLVALSYRAPVHALSAEYPLVLNTGRIRDQWHTMTRSGLTPRLLQHIGEPFAEMHPDEAKNRSLKEGGLVRLRSRWGSAVARVQFNDGQKPGHVFMPMHWTGVLSRSGRVGAVVNPAVDPVSGQPENKHTPVAAEIYPAAWHGYLLSAAPLA